MSNQEQITASQQLIRNVRNARAKATVAEHSFESERNRLETILSIRKSLADAADSVRDAKEACDELYMTYQRIVLQLDLECRPLLVNGINKDAVDEVRSAICHFNEESKISTNFSAAFNGIDLGELAAVRYMPTADMAAIQFFWDNVERDSSVTIINTPTPELPEDKLSFGEDQVELMRKKRETEWKAKKEKYDADESAFKEQQKPFKQRYEAIVQVTEEWGMQFKNELEQCSQEQVQSFRKENENQINSLTDEKNKLESELNKLGAFKMAQKKEIRTKLKTINNKLSELQAPRKETDMYNTLMAETDVALEAYEDKVKQYINRRFPALKRPQWVAEKIANSPDSAIGPATIEELNDIYDLLRNRGKMTISQIADESPWYSARRISCLLKALKSCYSVEETAEGEFTFYQATLLEPIEDVPKYHAPTNKYHENPAEASKPIPTPNEVAPKWWHITTKYEIPPILNTPVIDEEYQLTMQEMKEIMLAALVKYGRMTISELLEKAPELPAGAISSIGRILERQGLVKKAYYSRELYYETCI